MADSGSWLYGDREIDRKIPVPGDAIPRRGNMLTKAIARFWLFVFGWRFEGDLPNVAKAVVIAAPHTSNWDFLLAMAVIFAVGVDIKWLGKHTFVGGPFGGILRWLGGIAVDRRGSQGLVGQTVAEFARRDKLLLGLAPEGTRKKVERWKMGFYHIAQGAGMPILPVYFDYGRKVVGFGPLVEPSGDAAADMERIRFVYEGVVGRNPEQAMLAPDDV